MKLSEIGEAQRADGVDFIQNEIKHVITDFGDRDPGSEGERKALSYMSDTLTQLGADVKTESFKVAPHAFFGWTYFVSIFMVGVRFRLFSRISVPRLYKEGQAGVFL